MHALPTITLASSGATLLAMDVPLPIEMGALVMVGMILRWLIRRENHTEALDEKRLTRLEGRIDELQNDVSEQRHLKHTLLNQLAAIRGSILVIRRAAERCTCESMIPVLPVLEMLEKETAA